MTTEGVLQLRKIIKDREATITPFLSPKLCEILDLETILACRIEKTCLQWVLATMDVLCPERAAEKRLSTETDGELHWLDPVGPTSRGGKPMAIREHLEAAAQRLDSAVSQYLADLDLAVKGGNQDDIDHFFVVHSLAVASRVHAYRLLETLDILAKSQIEDAIRAANAGPHDRPAA